MNNYLVLSYFYLEHVNNPQMLLFVYLQHVNNLQKLMLINLQRGILFLLFENQSLRCGNNLL